MPALVAGNEVGDKGLIFREKVWEEKAQVEVEKKNLPNEVMRKYTFQKSFELFFTNDEQQTAI